MNREQAKNLIKEQVKATDFLEKSKGGLYCCPLCHSGHGTHGTGAVKYYPDTNTWYCHACDRGGDVIDAYTAQNGGDYNEALTILAARAGLELDSRETAKNDRPERPQSDEKQTKGKTLDEHKKAAENVNFRAYFEECRKKISDPAAISYLEARGISENTARLFNLGFDPAADPANAPGAMTDENKLHPTPRIIAPCANDFYIARSIDPNTPAAFKAPNPRGTHAKLFNTAALYNGAEAVFITEGIFDALSFEEAGAAGISLNGKGNGKLLLKQLQENPTAAGFIIVHDNDDDPETAADTLRRAEELNRSLQAMNLQSIIYNVAGEYHDANDALQADPATFKARIAAAIRELKRDDLTAFLDKVTTEAYKPHRTGLNFLDEILDGGIIQQSLLLLMAAPGAGKTTLAQQLAEATAREKKQVIYFNFEMSREQMLAKAISARLFNGNGGNKSATQILQGYKWTDTDREKISAIIEEYRREQYPYIKYNPAGISGDLEELLSYLKAIGEEAKARGENAPAVVVDYLHLITSRAGMETQELIKKAVTGLKQYAIDYNTFVVGIVATNRASNKNGRLTMESGRDSSNLEYTADYQIALNYYKIDNGEIKPDDNDAIAELQQASRREMILRVLKSRFSEPGRSVKVMFDAKHNTFYGTCGDYTPPDGFILDSGAHSFDDDEQTTMITI